MVLLSDDACNEVMSCLNSKYTNTEKSLQKLEHTKHKIKDTASEFELTGLDISIKYNQNSLQILNDAINEVESTCGCNQ